MEFSFGSNKFEDLLFEIFSLKNFFRLDVGGNELSELFLELG